MKNVFLIYDDCCFYEIVILNYFMKFTGQDVVICSLNGSAITCMEGYSVNVDMALKDVEIDNIKSFIIPGGDIKNICNEEIDYLEGHWHGSQAALVHQEGGDGHRSAHTKKPWSVLTILSALTSVADSSHGHICDSIDESCDHHYHAYYCCIHVHDVCIELQKEG